MPLVPIPMTLDDISLDGGGGIATPDDYGNIHALIRHIGDVKRVRNGNFRLLRLIDNVPVRVVGIVPELQCHLVVVTSFGIEISRNILSKHEAVDDRALRAVVGSSVDIVALYLDVGTVGLLVLVPGRIARMVAVLGPGPLVVLEEIEGLRSLGMTSIILIHRISPGDIRLVLYSG